MLELVRALLRRRPNVSDIPFDRTSERGSRRALPFVTDLPVRSYLDNALPLSIVSADPRHFNVLLGGFVQMFFPDDKQEFDRVLMWPFLRTNHWEHEGFLESCAVNPHSPCLNRPEALVDLVCTHVDCGEYAEIHLDEYFLPGRPSYQTVHSVHDNMIVGYDAPARLFSLAGYGRDYEVCQIGFDDVLRAFYHAPKRQLSKQVLIFIRPRAAAAPVLDTRAIAWLLRDYVRSAATVRPMEMRRRPPYRRARRFIGAWGLATYDSFLAYLRQAARDRRPLDLRATRTLWEHKALMLKRLRCVEAAIGGEPRQSDAYVRVETLARAVRFEAFEYNVGGLDAVHLDAAAAHLREMRAMEESVLTQVASSLDAKRPVPNVAQVSTTIN